MPKKILLLLLLITLTVFLSCLSVGNDPFGARDFFAFWSGGRVFLEGGNPYNDTILKSTQVLNSWNPTLHSSYTQQFFNPPWTLPFFVILGSLPFKLATQLWILVGLLSATLIVKYLSEIFKAEKRSILIGSIIFVYAWYSLMVGQLSIFILLLLSYGVFNFEKYGPTWKAALGIFGVFLKPHLFIPLVIWGILNLGKQKYRVLAFKGAAIFVFMICLSELIHSGITFSWINREGLPIQWISSTLAALLQLCFLEPNGPPTWPLFLMPILGIVFSFIFYFKNPDAPLKEAFSVLLFLGVLFAPYAFPYDFVLCLPLVLITAQKVRGNTQRLSILLFPSVCALIFSYVSVSLHFQVFFLLLFGLLYLALRSQLISVDKSRGTLDAKFN